jgi:hypothetical protein
MNHQASRSQWVAIGLLATLLFSILFVRYYRKDSPPGSTPLIPAIVAVKGEVRAPGTYVLEGPGVTIGRAIEAAGGLGKGIPGMVPAEFALREIRGGQLVQVERSAQGAVEIRVEPMPAAARLTLGEKLNLNAASKEELMLVPQMKAGLAAAIVEHRRRGTWQGLDELQEIPGVGPKTVGRWKNYLEVREEGMGGEYETER